MKKIESQKLHGVKILKKNISNFALEFEEGDEVQIIGIGERGCDSMEVSSGTVIYECGWDIFKEK